MTSVHLYPHQQKEELATETLSTRAVLPKRLIFASLLTVIVACSSWSPVQAAVVPSSRTMALVQSGDMSSDAIRDAASRVMQGQDFRGVRRRVLENVTGPDTPDSGFLSRPLEAMGTAIGDFFDWLFQGFGGNPAPRRARATPAAAPTPPATGGGGGLNFSLGSVFLYLGLGALIVVTIFIIAAVLKKSDPNRKMDLKGLLGEDGDITDLTTPPGELAASTYETRAIQMARDGNYRTAIRELLIGSMSWIERAGLIRFRKGLTNRDYVRAIWRQTDRREAYTVTAIEFERIYFGRRDATRDTFENCLRSFQESFREEEKKTAAV